MQAAYEASRVTTLPSGLTATVSTERSVALLNASDLSLARETMNTRLNGRLFTAKDPIGFRGGDTNVYAYVGGNPLSYGDPSGLIRFPAFLAQMERHRFMRTLGLMQPTSGQTTVPTMSISARTMVRGFAQVTSSRTPRTMP